MSVCECGAEMYSYGSRRCRDCWLLTAQVRESLFAGMWLDEWPTGDMAAAVGIVPTTVCGLAVRMRRKGWDLPKRRSAFGLRGADNNRFNNGLCFAQGRWMICCRDGTLMFFYRGVMAAEIGRLLTPDEIVHHRNEDPADDRLENLEITTRAEHMEMHREAIRRGQVAA